MHAGRKNDDGTVIVAPPFRWISTADYLATQDTLIDDSQKKCLKVEIRKAVSDSNAFTIDEEHNGSTSKKCFAPIVLDVHKNLDAAVSGTIAVSGGDEEVRSIGVMWRKLKEKESNDAAHANECLRRIHEGIADGTRLNMEDQKHSEKSKGCTCYRIT